MKKLALLLIALVSSLGLYAQFGEEEVIVTPDSLHLYFHGCSPHGERVSITNNTSEILVINRIYSENFYVECLYEGENIAEEGAFVPIGETWLLDTYAYPLGKATRDVYGYLNIDTDFGIYSIVLYYETAYAIDESSATLQLYPNPANDMVTLDGPDLGTVSVYNVLGQKVDEFVAEKQLRIPTADYPNGIFFVRTSTGATRRFVVTHN